MLCVTTNSIDGKVVRSYRGLVAAEVVFGANLFRDVAASITDVVGGRSMSYEKEFEGARRTAVDLVVKKAEALRADAILGMRFDYQVLGEKNGMMMVAVSGTAVQLTKTDEEKAKEEEYAREDAALYFVAIGSSEKGPFSILQLRELIAAGKIQETSMFRIEGQDGTRAIAELLLRKPVE